MNHLLFFSQFLNSDKLPNKSGSSDSLTTAFTLLFGFIGALALLMLVVAGFRYITSEGEPAKVAEAKNQILYAVIGLILAGSAVAIVNFVVGRF